jgi:hypothetical protein
MLNFSRPPRASPQARGETEELIPDPRGALTPAEIVEHKLTALLSRCGQGISQVLVCRRSSRNPWPVVTRCAARDWQSDRKSLLTLDFRSPVGRPCRAAGHYLVASSFGVTFTLVTWSRPTG